MILISYYFSLGRVSEPQSRYLPAAPHHLDYKYKKAVYVEYTDGSFTQRKNTEHTLLGPLLKGKVSDQIHVSEVIEGKKKIWLTLKEVYFALLLADLPA